MTQNDNCLPCTLYMVGNCHFELYCIYVCIYNMYCICIVLYCICNCIFELYFELQFYIVQAEKNCLSRPLQSVMKAVCTDLFFFHQFASHRSSYPCYSWKTPKWTGPWTLGLVGHNTGRVRGMCGKTGQVRSGAYYSYDCLYPAQTIVFGGV